MDTAPTQEQHRRFLNRYYGGTRHIYDWTRKYFLFGRDAAIDRLLESPWDTLLEVGVGTGRNLDALHNRRPGARYAGLDASDAMLQHVRERYPWVVLAQGFAEDHDLGAVLGAAPERVLFSYSLSMVTDPAAALRNARLALAPGGKVVVVDFSDLARVPGGVRTAFVSGWLKRFHVTPLEDGLLEAEGASIHYGPGRYYLIAELGPLAGE